MRRSPQQPRARLRARSSASPHQRLDTDGARALEPSLAPVFRHALHWPDAATVSNPLMVTRAYAARFGALGGVIAER